MVVFWDLKWYVNTIIKASKSRFKRSEKLT